MNGSTPLSVAYETCVREDVVGRLLVVFGMVIGFMKGRESMLKASDRAGRT